MIDFIHETLTYRLSSENPEALYAEQDALVAEMEETGYSARSVSRFADYKRIYLEITFERMKNGGK